MLSVAEETVLLGYAGRSQPNAAGTYDVSLLFGRGGGLVGAALLMDLVLEGRVRMEYPRTPEQRARCHVALVAGMLGVLGGVVLLAVVFGGTFLVTRVPGTSPVAIWVPFVAVALLVAALGILGAIRAERMIVVEASPTGDAVLDEALQGMLRVGARARILTYLRRYFLRRATFSSYSTALRRKLEIQGLLAEAGQQATFFGLLERRHVNRAHPEFQAISDRVRRLILQGDMPDANVVALAILFSRQRETRSLRHPGTRAQWGIDQFFSTEELLILKRRLKEIRQADPSITAQLGSDIYDCLVAIQMTLEELQRQYSSAG